MKKRLIIQPTDQCLIIESEVKKEWKPILFYGLGSFFLGAPIYFSLSIVEGDWWLIPIALLIALIGYFCLKKFFWQLIGFEKIVIKEDSFKIITMGFLNENVIEQTVSSLKSIQEYPNDEEPKNVSASSQPKSLFALFKQTQLQFNFDKKEYRGVAGYDHATYNGIIEQIETFIQKRQLS